MSARKGAAGGAGHKISCATVDYESYNDSDGDDRSFGSFMVLSLSS